MSNTPPIPEVRPNVRGQMLPGVAAICMFMIFMVMINVYAALKGAYGGGMPRYGVLAICTLLAVGVFGLLRLYKWGWALVAAGSLLLASGDFFYFSRLHVAFFLVRAGLVLVFFLYLIRREVRERLR